MESYVQKESKEIQAGAERAKKEIDEAGSRMKSKAVGAWDDVVNLVKKYPGQALGIAVLAGLATGLFSSRFSRRRLTASDNLRDLAGSGTEAWGKIREGFDEALGTMKEALEDAVAKFK